MNFQTIKALSEVKLQGVKIEWTREDKGVKEVRISDDAGGLLVIKSGNSYSETVKLLVPAIEEADRYALVGTFLGLTPVREVFEDEHEAKSRLDEFRAKSGYTDDHGLKIEKVRVRIDDSGAATVASDLPF